ncbi:hypothetical protein [Frankia sp. Cppng1_Ct_nod]|nr:hypothetical protein [Frankia sp. Cppng1_Ct_nod]
MNRQRMVGRRSLPILIPGSGGDAAEDLADATVREVERIARELLRRGGEK